MEKIPSQPTIPVQSFFAHAVLLCNHNIFFTGTGTDLLQTRRENSPKEIFMEMIQENKTTVCRRKKKKSGTYLYRSNCKQAPTYVEQQRGEEQEEGVFFIGCHSLSSNTSKFTKIAQQRDAGKRSGKKKKNRASKSLPDHHQRRGDKTSLRKTKRGIVERQIVRGDKAGFCPIRSWANNKRGRAGRAGDERGFRRFLLSSSSSIRPRVLSSSDVQHVCSSKPHCLFLGKES